MLTTAGPASRWIFFLRAFLIFAVLSGLWALASPMTSIPDEPPHSIRAASVVRGEILTPIPEGSSESQAFVPRYIAHTKALRCFAFDSTIDASCQAPATGDQDEIVEASTSSGPNSPLYYAIVGLPTLVFSGNAALYGMRAVNVLLSSALVAVMVMSAFQLVRRRFTLLATIVSMTPMVVFLSGAINPNAIEALAAGALFLTLVAYLRTPSPGALLWERGTIIVLTTLLLVHTRSIAMLWLALVVGLAIACADRDLVRSLARRRSTWLIVGASAVASLSALAWYLYPKPVGEPPSLTGIGQSFADGAISMLDATFDFASGWIGLFGWLDRPAPTITYLIWTVAIGMIILGALVLGRGGPRIAVIACAAAAVIVPPVVQGALVTDFGYIWQGRYMLAVYTCLILAAGVALDIAVGDRFTATVSAFATTIVIAMGAAQVLTFVWVLRRYVVGGGSWIDMIAAPQWQPPLGWTALTGLYLVACTLATWAAVRMIRVRALQPVTSLTV